MDEKTTDRVERLVGLELDGRLDEAARRELDRLLRDGAAVRVRDEMVGVRELLRRAEAPALPPLLRDRIVARVAVARDERATTPLRLAGGGTLRLVQAITVAAAITLGATAWVTSGGAVRADDQLEHPRTVEDELRERTDDDGSIAPYLEWRFLGAER